MIALRRLLRRQDGATAIEYALIAGLISLAIVAGATTIGGNLSTGFQTVAAGFPN
ncbi:MAG: Flp family type IVb pilin [Caulobacterales bacterium]